VATQAIPEVDAQYRELREGAGMLERPERAVIEVIGPDAAEFLQGQVTNDVVTLAPGQGCYAALLNPKGRIVADMRILRTAPERFVLDTEIVSRDAVLRDLRMYKIGRRVEIADTTDRSLVSLIGPGADAVTETAIGARPGPEEHSLVEVEGVVAVRTDTGIDLIADRDAAAVLQERLLAAGARPVSFEAAEIVRIESGRPRHGVDMSEENLPAEAGIVERAVSFTKGCYVGQEPVARMHYKGHPNRHLRGLRLAEPVDAGAKLSVDDKEVGRVTSSALSPALGPIALALVRREVEPGEKVSIDEGGPTATVVEVPFASS
jgi:tRNA-modifying protein YgfZ